MPKTNEADYTHAETTNDGSVNDDGPMIDVRVKQAARPRGRPTIYGEPLTGAQKKARWRAKKRMKENGT